MRELSQNTIINHPYMELYLMACDVAANDRGGRSRVFLRHFLSHFAGANSGNSSRFTK